MSQHHKHTQHDRHDRHRDTEQDRQDMTRHDTTRHVLQHAQTGTGTQNKTDKTRHDHTCVATRQDRLLSLSLALLSVLVCLSCPAPLCHDMSRYHTRMTLSCPAPFCPSCLVFSVVLCVLRCVTCRLRHRRRHRHRRRDVFCVYWHRRRLLCLSVDVVAMSIGTRCVLLVVFCVYQHSLTGCTSECAS